MTGRGPANRGQTKFQPLIEFLAAQTDRDVTLSFADIEEIIGVPLSVTASNESATWRSTRQRRVRRWREMGWDARFDRQNQCVHFTRDVEE